MSFLVGILPFVGIIILLVVVHELGHFITAKLAGVRVLEFGLGYPPRLWAKRLGETEYSLNVLPLGGFVRLVGEEDPSQPRSLASRPRPLRLLVLTSGSFMNLLLPIVLFTASFLIPHEVPYGRAVISEVVAGAPAAAAGLQPGDIIYRINGRNVRNVREVGYNIRLHLGETIVMQVRRGQQFLDIPVRARWAPPPGQGPTGIVIGAQHPGVALESFPFPEALRLGFRSTFEAFLLIRNEIVSWIKGAASPRVAGPVGIAQAAGEVVEVEGLQPLLDFTAFLSINLAIINLLPLPMLDGGRIMFVLLEILRRGKRIAPEKEGLVHLIGFTFILGVAIIITYFDILRLIQGESFFR